MLHNFLEELHYSHIMGVIKNLKCGNFTKFSNNYVTQKCAGCAIFPIYNAVNT
jgi:hypothetical protein